MLIAAVIAICVLLLLLAFLAPRLSHHPERGVLPHPAHARVPLGVAADHLGGAGAIALALGGVAAPGPAIAGWQTRFRGPRSGILGNTGFLSRAGWAAESASPGA